METWDAAGLTALSGPAAAAGARLFVMECDSGWNLAAKFVRAAHAYQQSFAPPLEDHRPGDAETVVPRVCAARA